MSLGDRNGSPLPFVVYDLFVGQFSCSFQSLNFSYKITDETFEIVMIPYIVHFSIFYYPFLGGVNV